MKGSIILLFPILAIANLLTPRSTGSLSGITVQTANGPIVGHQASNRSNVSEYLGIPYAQPPIGLLRFAAPQRYGANETFVASKFVSWSGQTVLFWWALTPPVFLVCVCCRTCQYEKSWLLTFHAVAALPILQNLLPIPMRHHKNVKSWQISRTKRITRKARIAWHWIFGRNQRKGTINLFLSSFMAAVCMLP